MSKIKAWAERVSVGYESCDAHEAMQAEIDELRAALQELNLQYISDFGQLQEQEPVMYAFERPDGTWHDASQVEHSAGMKPLYASPIVAIKEQP